MRALNAYLSSNDKFVEWKEISKNLTFEKVSARTLISTKWNFCNDDSVLQKLATVSKSDITQIDQ